jgi:hypothetical protein
VEGSALKRARGVIFIYCDEQSHPKREAVTNFKPYSGLLGSGWHELPASRGHGAGRSIVNNAPATAGWANDPGIANSDHRNRYEFSCRKCRKPVVAREEKLFSALDKFAADGESEIPLSKLAARVSSS